MNVNKNISRQEPTRTVLIGTARTVREMLHVLEMADPQPAVIGAVILDGHDEQSATTVLGTEADLSDVVARHAVQQVLISVPAAWKQRAQRLAGQCERLKARARILPTLAEQLAGCVAIPSRAPSIDPLELINRSPRPLDERAIQRTITGKAVMITGAGGSIGSDLARIVGKFEPSRLILVERAENALFEIDGEIRHLHPNVARAAVLHDVSDAGATLRMVGEQLPDVIFHAAAHKHVPMMEDHPSQAVENNFYGTRSIADAADHHRAERFVMISSDKAVNPSSVMGATKRLAELYIQFLNTRSETNYSMVRFGNVLGSACSVLPIWQQQLERGGPITVTHEDMTRYFMTIPEAAGLVIQSAAYSNLNGSGGGEVFLLDMGEPVRIVDFAERFIRSQGFVPGEDVEIAITGIRPGEKLFEELAYDGEDMLATPHDSIHIWQTTPPDTARMQQLCATFDRLRNRREPGDHLWQHASRDAIVTALQSAVPEMHHRMPRAVAG